MLSLHYYTLSMSLSPSARSSQKSDSHFVDCYFVFYFYLSSLFSVYLSLKFVRPMKTVLQHITFLLSCSLGLLVDFIV